MLSLSTNGLVARDLELSLPKTREVTSHDSSKALSVDEAGEIACHYVDAHCDGRSICVIAIYGSVARGTNAAQSDVDVLAIHNRTISPHKRNVVFRQRRLQFVHISDDMIRRRIRKTTSTRNSFLIDAVTEARFVRGSVGVLDDLKAYAQRFERPLPDDPEPMILSITSRVADALEKLEYIGDPNHRMFIAVRVYSLIQELAVIVNGVWPYQGAASYQQTTRLAPALAVRLADCLRSAIATDEYGSFCRIIESFFDRFGGLKWDSDCHIPI